MSDWDFFVQSLRVGMKLFAVVAVFAVIAMILLHVFRKGR